MSTSHVATTQVSQPQVCGPVGLAEVSNDLRSLRRPSPATALWQGWTGSPPAHPYHTVAQWPSNPGLCIRPTFPSNEAKVLWQVHLHDSLDFWYPKSPRLNPWQVTAHFKPSPYLNAHCSIMDSAPYDLVMHPHQFRIGKAARLLLQSTTVLQ